MLTFLKEKQERLYISITQSSLQRKKLETKRSIECDKRINSPGKHNDPKQVCTKQQSLEILEAERSTQIHNHSWGIQYPTQKLIEHLDRKPVKTWKN